MCRKKHLWKSQTPWAIWFFWYFMNIEFLSLVFLLCTKKWLCSKSIHEKPLLASPSGPTIQAVSVKWYPRNVVPKTYLQSWQKFQVSVKFWLCSKQIISPWNIPEELDISKVFGFFHGYFVNTNLFCHLYTSSND